MYLPAGLDVDGKKLKQASFKWTKMLKSGLIKLGYTPSKADTHVCTTKKILCMQSMLMILFSGNLMSLKLTK